MTKTRTPRWPYLLAAALFVVLVVSQLRLGNDSRRVGSWEDVEGLGARPDLNVLFILIDTLRADRLGAYGYERDTSQTLDALAETGIRFERHIAQSSWTKTSMVSLWTGLYPVRTGVLRYMHALSSEAKLPAEILREAGFRTAALWRNGWVAPNFGLSQGFDTYLKPSAGTVKVAQRRENPESQLAGSDIDVTQGALQFMKVNVRQRWFLYLHYMDVHQYLSDEESARFGTSYSDIYDNSIHWLDRHVATLLDGLEELDLRHKTIVVVASDHGEAFGEHGSEGHAKAVYGEETRTPFIMSLPFRLEPGISVPTPSQNVDVWPTLLDLLDLPGLSDADGRSLLDDIRRVASGDATEAIARASFAQIDRYWGQPARKPYPLVAVTDPPYRYIFPIAAPEKAELYDLERDPLEQSNLAAEQPEVSERLRKDVETYLASKPPPWGVEVPEVTLDDLLLGQLRALGYVVK